MARHCFGTIHTRWVHDISSIFIASNQIDVVIVGDGEKRHQSKQATKRQMLRPKTLVMNYMDKGYAYENNTRNA
jgi:hypothetical protein